MEEGGLGSWPEDAGPESARALDASESEEEKSLSSCSFAPIEEMGRERRPTAEVNWLSSISEDPALTSDSNCIKSVGGRREGMVIGECTVVAKSHESRVSNV